MRRCSEAVKADVRRRMSPPHRQSVAQVTAEQAIHVINLYGWRKAWRLQWVVVPASEKNPEGWGATDMFTVVLATAGTDILHAPKTVRDTLDTDVNDFMLAVLDPEQHTVMVRVSTNY